jgi:hypothetical protein
MSTQTDPLLSSRGAERGVIRLAKFEDGLWDILLGCVFMLLGIYPVTRQLLGPTWNLVAFLAAMCLLIAAFMIVRRVYSVPRLGLVRFRQRRLTTITRITALIVLVSLVLATAFVVKVVPHPVLAGAPAWLNRLAMNILGSALVIGFFTVQAHVTGVPRLHLYGWLIGVGALASTALMVYAGLTFNLPLALAAGVIILVGIGRFAGFLRRYPLPAEEG